MTVHYIHDASHTTEYMHYRYYTIKSIQNSFIVSHGHISNFHTKNRLKHRHKVPQKGWVLILERSNFKQLLITYYCGHYMHNTLLTLYIYILIVKYIHVQWHTQLHMQCHTYATTCDIVLILMSWSNGQYSMVLGQSLPVSHPVGCWKLAVVNFCSLRLSLRFTVAVQLLSQAAKDEHFETIYGALAEGLRQNSVKVRQDLDLN